MTVEINIFSSDMQILMKTQTTIELVCLVSLAWSGRLYAFIRFGLMENEECRVRSVEYRSAECGIPECGMRSVENEEY